MIDAPPAGVTSADRINLQGISYLYVSNSEKTAALEVRLVITQYVSVAEIEIAENAKIFDFTANYNDKEAKNILNNRLIGVLFQNIFLNLIIVENQHI